MNKRNIIYCIIAIGIFIIFALIIVITSLNNNKKSDDKRENINSTTISSESEVVYDYDIKEGVTFVEDEGLDDYNQTGNSSKSLSDSYGKGVANNINNEKSYSNTSVNKRYSSPTKKGLTKKDPTKKADNNVQKETTKKSQSVVQKETTKKNNQSVAEKETTKKNNQNVTEKETTLAPKAPGQKGEWGAEIKNP